MLTAMRHAFAACASRHLGEGHMSPTRLAIGTHSLTTAYKTKIH